MHHHRARSLDPHATCSVATDPYRRDSEAAPSGQPGRRYRPDRPQPGDLPQVIIECGRRQRSRTADLRRCMVVPLVAKGRRPSVLVLPRGQSG